MSTFSPRQQVALVFLLFVLLSLLVPNAGHGGDLEFWVAWSRYIFEHGLGNVYQLEDNTYNPVYHYILWAYGKCTGSLAAIDHYRHWIKSFVLLFDFGGAFWAASLVRERNRRFGLALLLLLNIAYLYNTLIWAQIDTIYTFFAFGAVVLAVQQRAATSMMCYFLALATKTQAIIFLPPLLLLWGPLWWQRPWRFMQALGSSALLAVALLAPFIWWSWENYLPRIIKFNIEVTEVFPKVTMGAFNLWYLLEPNAESTVASDALPFAGLTYHGWGLLLFCSFSALALFPLLVRAVARLRTPLNIDGTDRTDDLALTLLSCGLVPLFFAYFNTQMHERYWHATVLFLAAYGFIRRDYWPVILASVAYFLNLEAILRFVQLKNYGVLIFNPQFIAGLFSLVIVLGLVKLYRLTAWRSNWQACWASHAPPAPNLPVTART